MGNVTHRREMAAEKRGMRSKNCYFFAMTDPIHLKSGSAALSPRFRPCYSLLPMRCSRPWRKCAGSWDRFRPPTSGLVPVGPPPWGSTSAMPRAAWTGSSHMPLARGSRRSSGPSSMPRRSLDLLRRKPTRSFQPSRCKSSTPSCNSAPRRNPLCSTHEESAAFSCPRRCWDCCSMPPSTRSGMWGRSLQLRGLCRGSKADSAGRHTPRASRSRTIDLIRAPYTQSPVADPDTDGVDWLV